MGLKYKFRHLFFGNKFHKERMWNTLEDLDERITALESSNSSETPSTSTESETPTEQTTNP